MINVNSLINNYMNFLELCENIIKEVKPDSMEDIATKLDIKYNGIQEGYKNIPPMHLFTDLKTGSTFSVNIKAKEEDVLKALSETREKFKDI